MDIRDGRTFGWPPHLVVALGLCAMAMVSGVSAEAGHAVAAAFQPRLRQSTAATGQAVTEITLERRCFGCGREYAISFRRDGNASRILFGNARSNTEDRGFTGHLDPGEFDALAELLRREGFFALEAEYPSIHSVDGEWSTTRAIASLTKAVLNVNGAAPDSLKRIEKAIDTLSERTQWAEVAAPRPSPRPQ